MLFAVAALTCMQFVGPLVGLAWTMAALVVLAWCTRLPGPA